jgi:hypothetical protein
MSRSLKMSLLGLPLIPAGYCAGLVCRRLGQEYYSILFPSQDLLWLLPQLLASFWFVAVAAGVASALVRPVWAAMLAFIISGLAVLAGVGWSPVAGAAVLLYVLTGCSYALRVARDLAERTSFSSRAVSDVQTGLVVAMAVLVSSSLYVGFAARIEAEGFSIPSEYVEAISARLGSAVEEHLPGLVRDLTMGAIRDGIAFAVDNVLVGAISALEEWIPLIVAVVVFAPLVTITRLLAWVPSVALRAAFAGLKSLRVVRVVRATREVERLIVW